jgi:ABC-2 type transport system ATP-binding protein
MSRNSILTVSDLVIRYPKTNRPAVDGISFQVEPGEVLGILGGNGAGKSSSLKAVAGLLPISYGSILLDGKSISSVSSDKESARDLIGYCPDTGGLIRQATVYEHIQILMSNKNRAISEGLALEIIKRMGLEESLNNIVGGFSHGMSRRLAVSLAALNAQKLMILDEPFDGVDPLGVEAIQEIVLQAKSAGLAVILSTHLLSLLAESTDRIIIMNKGRILYETQSTEFKSYDAHQKYSSILKADNNADAASG